MRSCWNDDEHLALRGLSMLAQLIYLKVFRRRMNYQTGIAGGPGNKITLSTIIEECRFVPDPRSPKKFWEPTRGEVRAAIAELERARAIWGDPDELISMIVDAGSGFEAGYIKKCILADTDQSARNKNDPRTTRERPSQNDPESTEEVQQNQRQDEYEQPRTNFAAPAKNNPSSGNRLPEEREEEYAPTEKQPTTSGESGNRENVPGSRRTRTSPTRIAADWEPDATSVEWIESHGVTLSQARPAILEFRDYWSSRSTRRADWQRTFRNNGKVEVSLMRLAGMQGPLNGSRNERGPPRQAPTPEPTGPAYQVITYDDTDP